MAIYHGNHLGKALIEEGICPPNCSNVELHVPVSGGVFLRYEVWVSDQDIPKIQRALGAMVEPKKEEQPA